jgi:hypothetical protein
MMRDFTLLSNTLMRRWVIGAAAMTIFLSKDTTSIPQPKANFDLSDPNVYIPPGELTTDLIHQIASGPLRGSALEKRLDWFATHGELFPFSSWDGLVLQGFQVKHDATSLSSFSSSSEDGPVAYRGTIVLGPGLSETFVKHADFFFQMHRAGWDLYGYDLRSQGFSGGGYDKDIPGRIGHIDSIDDYTQDLVSAPPSLRS